MSSIGMSQNNNIYPKLCIYGCGLNLYWNTATSEYWEVFTIKKHICPNRSSNNKKSTTNAEMSSAITTKPNYYNKFAKPQFAKPKMSNSFELLTGPIETIQKKYEVFSDIVSDYNGKVHGSQSHNVTNNS